MQIRYYELVGKKVITAEGRSIGRLVDLVAEPDGDSLRVTTLLVGPAALARRIAFKRVPLFGVAPPRTIPWQLVARVAEHVHLTVDAAGLEASHPYAAIAPPKEQPA